MANRGELSIVQIVPSIMRQLPSSEARAALATASNTGGSIGPGSCPLSSRFDGANQCLLQPRNDRVVRHVDDRSRRGHAPEHFAVKPLEVSGVPEGVAISPCDTSCRASGPRGPRRSSRARVTLKARVRQKRTIEKRHVPPVQIPRGNVDVGSAVKPFEVEHLVGLERSLDAAITNRAHAGEVAQPARPDECRGDVERAEDPGAQ